jgi:hypothetical protein
MNIGCQENIISILVRIEVERLFILKSSQYNPLSSGVTNRNQLHRSGSTAGGRQAMPQFFCLRRVFSNEPHYSPITVLRLQASTHVHKLSTKK